MLLRLCFYVVALYAALTLAQLPVESYQRWLMIIKPNANAGGEFVGNLNQSQIDNATIAFKQTFPQTISDLTKGRLHLETHVIVSPCTLTAVHQKYKGMVGPEHIPADVKAHVSPADWDGVAIYAGFTEQALWGISAAADVGWFSVSAADNLTYGSQTMAAWTHEMLHTLSWYFGDGRLGPVAPKCGDVAAKDDGRDGTHCGPQNGYVEKGGGRKDWMGYYADYLNGDVKGGLGLGSKAWKLGTRREAFSKVPPGSLRPKELIGDDTMTRMGRREARRKFTMWKSRVGLVPVQ